jgi:uncharacterized membrane protein YqiK
MEKARGTADMQADLATAQVSVDIQRNQAEARRAEGEGEAAFVRLTGEAEAARTEAIGLAKAAGFEAQRDAIGAVPTAVVAVVGAIADGGVDIMPDVLVTGTGGTLDGLAATLMNTLREPRRPSPEGGEDTPEPEYEEVEEAAEFEGGGEEEEPEAA